MERTAAWKASNCPRDPEQTAEDYVMNFLDPAQKTAFAFHCQSCSDCAAFLAEAEEFVKTLRQVLPRLNRSRQVH